MPAIVRLPSHALIRLTMRFAVVLTLLAGAIIPLSMTASSAEAATLTARAKAAHIAPQYLGVPYRWGGNTPAGFDCSGYTQYVYHRSGKSLPRTAAEQYAYGVWHISKSRMKPGDLVFFKSGGHVYHVAIYAGHNRIWHAPAPGQHVRLQTLWTSNWYGGLVK